MVYGFHMPLFFLLSGLFIESWAKKGFTKGVSQKAKFILIPYLVWSLLQGGVNVILSSVTNNPLTWKELIINIWIAPIAQFWFLYVLFLMFVLFYFLRSVSSLRKTLIVSLILYVFAPYLDYWVLKSLMTNFFFFILGAKIMNFNLKRIEEKVSGTKYLIGSIIIFAVLNAVYLALNLGIFSEHIFKLIIALLGVNLLIVISVHISKLGIFKSIQNLGMLSMAIYLAHILVASGTRIILSKLLHVNNLYIHVIVGTLLGIVLPVIAYKISEKVKVNNIIFGR
ncbi:acyltransferase family protein [Ectobacillus funiculus]